MGKRGQATLPDLTCVEVFGFWALQEWLGHEVVRTTMISTPVLIVARLMHLGFNPVLR